MSLDWAESALRWWHDAGVDALVDETPRDWLKPVPPAVPAASAPAPIPVETAPATLEAFQAWLLESERIPLAAPSAARVGPSGDPGSGLMVVVDMPGPHDAAAGHLLSGEPGALFDRMLKAIGRSRETVYLASLSPIRSPTGTFDAETGAALADMARHHIGLVAPRAVLLFGDACAKALTGAAVAGARGRWHEIETKAGKIRTLVTIRPEKLMTQPGLKKLAWEDLQMLMGGFES